MNRPWKVWLVFGVCAAVVMTAMAWVSLTTLRLERAQLQAGERAEVEERVRLALWRMDSALAPLVIEESARPWSAYVAFSATERALTKGGQGYNPVQKGEVLVPSPLLDFNSSNILLHFQYRADGRLTSPQVPEGEQRQLAKNSYTTGEHIATAATRLADLRRILDARVPAEFQITRDTASSPGAQIAQTAPWNNGGVLLRETSLPLFANNIEPPVQALVLNNDPRQAEQQQLSRNTAEFAQRANIFQVAQQGLADNYLSLNAPAQPGPQQSGSQRPPAAGEGLFKPIWLGDALVLARRVNLSGNQVVQGVWLNWPHLRASLLASVKDLFPAANLQPMRRPNGEREARMLASLPVKLLPGAVPTSSLIAWTPIRLTLVLAWACVLIAALAVGLLLHGTLSLSERRAAFVSAVTHELRTPLTTFKMYSEMLAGDMVTNTETKKGYLATLCSEANRLNHLVENVLAYARLERGSARYHVERVALGELIERVKPRLVQRLEQADMKLATDANERGLKTLVHVDVSAVEQILFNLVDNACKYAAPGATDKTVHLEALPTEGRNKFAMLRVRDHGQGISAEAARRLFQPFSKSAGEAARTAPGVGLGLAMCRRLSRSLGGELRWESGIRDGASFVLALPVTGN